ncbi:hypothetical protein CHS0354_027377 [Potamilus streckersoni]|uniref:Uncharacterized protein n=1 Tax=Potamilus streckersoni TaxID=2493646 RepID=A0AAE0SQ14_9BIVA|nr:hypothetical protein CHS0354_027377 [Potamilus streckersoni]
MWFNSKQRAEPYLGLKSPDIPRNRASLRGRVTVATQEHSRETAGDKPEEGGDDVKSSWPLQGGLHTCYNGDYRGLQPREGELIPKSRLSSDCTLQLGCMKSESLVIADQHAAVNTFPGLVHTARHTMGVGFTRSNLTNRKEVSYQAGINDWGEVVTR